MRLQSDFRQNYRFVLIRTAHEVIQYGLVHDLFPRIIHLKTTGYRHEYGQYVLPFDSSDFIASHLLLCRVDHVEGLLPVLGFKSVTLKVCDDYRIPFPMLGMLESNHHETHDHKGWILNLMNQYRERGLSGKLAYNGSFTIHPKFREDKNSMKDLWDITFSLLTNYYIEYNIDHVVAICATKFNVHKKKEQLGWNYVSGRNGPLNAYKCKSLIDSSFIPMELDGVRIKSEVPSSKFKDMWEKRLTLDLDSFCEDSIKKAA
jgi:hypothetical protein